MNPETVKLWSEIINTWVGIMQGCITTIGVMIAGIWSYYVFVRGRNFDPNIKIDINQKNSFVEVENRKAVVITARIKNFGKTKVDKNSCTMTTMPLVVDKDGLLTFANKTSASAQKINLLSNHTYLEPSEEISEDILISMDDNPAIKILVKFDGIYRNVLFGETGMSSSTYSIITSES